MTGQGIELPGMVIIEPEVHSDARGFFLETFRKDRYAKAGIREEFVQDNRSMSRRNVLRGLHYQIGHPQGHLVYVTHGEVFDVGLDLRAGSPAFGRWFCLMLSEEKPRQVYFPPGVAHGFLVLSNTAEILYKCTGYYHPGDEGGVLWNDADLGIPWPVGDPLVAERDNALPRLKDIPPKRLPRVTHDS